MPTVLASGEPFPGRDEIVFVAAGVVLLTLTTSPEDSKDRPYGVFAVDLDTACARAL